MSPERRVLLFQAGALAGIVPTLLLMWMHLGFGFFAGIAWYYPAITLGRRAS